MCVRREEVFGWMKTVGGFRQPRYRGLDRTGMAGYVVAAAYNLVRLAARRVLAEYVGHFNRGRPHQGIGQRTPMPVAGTAAPPRPHRKERVIAVPVLGGRHHEYRLAA